ncbi:GNAT family N-acetyltransferase [Clostridium polynesiense]|uniref:GNAT family N-acetyltransferase n=1 Tax=Clostridium polynesiense TaxID=1325933 RepID=UPI00058AC2AF|nr:GNAT family N-acetyltransferase [Clostridium polynesiense]
MTKVYLVKPGIEYKEEYLNMIEEWKSTGEEFTPWVLSFDASDFSALIKKLEKMSVGEGLEPEFVENSTYWLADDKKRILGAVNIRHRLNEDLLDRGGHIGYGIRPSERKKGYASELLRQALIIVKEMGMKRVLLTCDKENKGSAKTIVKNKGILESEGVYKGIAFQRYWIDLDN